MQREMAPGSALCYQETLVDILYIGVCLCEVGAPPSDTSSCHVSDNVG